MLDHKIKESIDHIIVWNIKKLSDTFCNEAVEKIFIEKIKDIIHKKCNSEAFEEELKSFFLDFPKKELFHENNNSVIEAAISLSQIASKRHYLVAEVLLGNPDKIDSINKEIDELLNLRFQEKIRDYESDQIVEPYDHDLFIKINKLGSELESQQYTPTSSRTSTPQTTPAYDTSEDESKSMFVPKAEYLKVVNQLAKTRQEKTEQEDAIMSAIEKITSNPEEAKQILSQSLTRFRQKPETTIAKPVVSGIGQSDRLKDKSL